MELYGLYQDIPPAAPIGLLARREAASLRQDYGHSTPRQASLPGTIFPPPEYSTELVATWLPVLARLDLNEAFAKTIEARTVANATSFTQELLACGELNEVELYRAIAAELGLAFIESVDKEALFINEDRRLASLRDRRGLRMALMRNLGGDSIHLIADPGLDLPWLKDRLAQSQQLRSALCIAPPSALRAAIIDSCSKRLLFDAQHSLLLRSPEFSARTVVTAWQAGAAVGMVCFFLFSLWLARLPTLIALQAVASVGFAACIALRLLAYGSARPLRLAQLSLPDHAAQPVYSVLVALYREREVLPQLLHALARLQWPRAKLEIKLVCEADDDETLAVLHSLELEPCMEVVLVPPGTPRTKPKALSYALPLCSGEIVTLYDAEDRPDPLQLVEAWQRFDSEGQELACVQAPLVITNGKQGALPLMFAFEYAALFRGILPWLARRGLILPLGGTSNHFRRSALDEVGGWDGYNVTEDAELGIRLGRYGYRTGVITRPTYEDAPERVSVWLPQRVRWFKGWLQTWLVHMREPVSLWRELGPASFMIAQILSLGMVVSALVHPLFVGSTIYLLAQLMWTGSLSSMAAIFGAIGMANILFGYAAFILLGMATLLPVESGRALRLVLLTPLHWLLLSVAAWLALLEIYRRPHHWSKTPHGIRSTPATN